MFERKRCRNCGERIKEGWAFCPSCGKEIKVEERREIIMPFGSMFEDIDKEFERIDRMFGPDFFKFPKFGLPKTKGGGVSITIRSGMGKEPEVDVKTSGEYKKLEPEIKRKLGVKPAIQEIEEEKLEKRKPKIPKVTEEPETKVKTVGNRQTISIKLPDVKSEDDVEVKKLEQSIEVKAFADDKAYFKLIPIHPDSRISEKSLKDGILKIEVVR